MICARKRHALQPLPAYFLSDLDLAQTVTLPASQEPAQPGSPLASAGAPDTDDVIASGKLLTLSISVARLFIWHPCQLCSSPDRCMEHLHAVRRTLQTVLTQSPLAIARKLWPFHTRSTIWHGAL